MAEIKIQKTPTAGRLITEGGISSGVIGGIVIAVLLMLITAGEGGSAWRVLKGASAPFFHQRAMMPGFDAAPVIAGVLIHFAVSIVWGLLFAVVAFGLSRAATVGVGALWGVVVWLVMFFAVLPVVGLGHHMGNPAVPLIEHIIFGLSVGVSFLPYQREEAQHRPWWRVRHAPR